MLYAPVLFAFVMMFHLLIPSNVNFQTLWHSMLKIAAMMLGDIGVQDNFTIEPSQEDNSVGFTQIAFLMFLLFGNIVIINLLIGFTVNKAEYFLEIADQIRLEKTVEQIERAEKWFDDSKRRSIGIHCFDCLPKWFGPLKTAKLFEYFDMIANYYEEPKTMKVCLKPFEPSKYYGFDLLHLSLIHI